MTREEELIVKILEIIDSKKYRYAWDKEEALCNIKMDDIKSDIIKLAGEMLKEEE